MHSFADLIDAFGAASLASVLRTDESHVRVMKARNSIPFDYWPAVIKAAADRNIRGINWNSLRKLREGRFPAREKASA